MAVKPCCSLPIQLQRECQEPHSPLCKGVHDLPTLSHTIIHRSHIGCIHAQPHPLISDTCLVYSLPKKISDIALSYLQPDEQRILNRACFAHLTPFWEHATRDKVTTFPLQALQEYYYTRTASNPAVVEQVFRRIIPHLGFLLGPDNDFFGEHIRSSVDIAQEQDSLWEFTLTASARTSIGKHPELPGYLFKFYMKPTGSPPMCEESDSSEDLNPMAHTLRVPMAVWMQKTISMENLTELGVSYKALIPLFPETTITTLDERSINHAYVIIAEEQAPASCSSTRFRQLSPETQTKITSQICALERLVPLGDCKWENWLYHDTRRQFVNIDTEPLLGELTAASTRDAAFAISAKLQANPSRTLQQCSTVALRKLADSSRKSTLAIPQAILRSLLPPSARTDGEEE